MSESQYPPPGQYPPPPPIPAVAPSSSKATTSLVLGVISVVMCGLFRGIPAMIIARQAKREIAESQGRLQTARLYNMTDDPGVKAMLKFNLARDTHHQNLWLAAIEALELMYHVRL